MDSTGNSTGTHVHWEVWLKRGANWANIDPLNAVNGIQIVNEAWMLIPLDGTEDTMPGAYEVPEWPALVRVTPTQLISGYINLRSLPRTTGSTYFGQGQERGDLGGVRVGGGQPGEYLVRGEEGRPGRVGSSLLRRAEMAKGSMKKEKEISVNGGRSCGGDHPGGGDAELLDGQPGVEAGAVVLPGDRGEAREGHGAAGSGSHGADFLSDRRERADEDAESDAGAVPVPMGDGGGGAHILEGEIANHRVDHFVAIQILAMTGNS